MNAECLTSATRRVAGLIAVAAVGTLLAGPAATQEPRTPPSVATQEPGKAQAADAPKPKDFQVYALKNASATDMARILDELFNGKKPGGSFRVVADPASNSLLVSASAAEAAQVKELLGKVLDMPRDNDPVLRLSVFALQSTEPDKSLEDALRLVFRAGTPGNFSLDRLRKQVIIAANEHTTKEVEALLVRLEQQPVNHPAADVQVRVVWLAGGKDVKEAPKPPDDLKEVLPGLAKMGIDQPRLIAQTLISVTPNTRFQAKGFVALNQYHFSVTGTLSDKNETPALALTLRADGLDNREICNLQTEISAPLGHLVVLGMTPMDSTTSVFVVQVLRKDTAKAPPPRRTPTP